MIITCYDVVYSEDDGGYYGDIWTYDKVKGQVVDDIGTTNILPSAQEVKTIVNNSHPGAMLVKEDF